MSSTENLLHESGDKPTNTLESGYHSERAEDELPRPKHREKVSKKKKHKDVGLENKGFESDGEQANRSVKRYTKVHRASSENAARQLTTKPEQTDENRRRSFSGQPSIDTTKTTDVVTQKGSSSRHRRRSSSADEDLRRRACFNSMRLRRVSSSESSQLPPSEVDDSVDDEVFYEDFAATNAREKQKAFGYGERNQLKENKRAYSMGSLCDVVEMENKKLDEYSRRLSYALEERAKLEQELSLLRRTASVASMPAEEKWKISSQIHFRNEKYNSERRISTRSNEGNQFSFEQLKRIQYGQGQRKLPDAPRADSGMNEEIRPVSEKNVERLPQRKTTEASPQQLEQEGKRDGFVLSKSEKERRERKTADLAADLWKKLLKGEKFHVEGEATIDKTRETSPNGTTTNGSPREATKSANSSYAKPGMIQRDSGRDIIGRLAQVSIPKTPGEEKREKTFVRSDSESNLARTDAFRRNQRRPLRYKRRSISTEALATHPSMLTLSESETNGLQQEKPENLEGIRSTEAVSQNHSKWFDYMLPPGKRGNRKDTPLQNSPQATGASQQRISGAELPLPEKLRYYQDLREQRSREENSFDLVDAFMAAEDAEAEREYQRKAAGEAAMLRREASRLLYQAMNLERICDPNARVRHIFTPY